MQPAQDPLEFRRKLISSPSISRVLNAVAERDRLEHAGAARRLSRPRPEHGLWQLRGGLRRSLGRRQGGVKIHRIVAATDPGYAVNPAQIERQIAGSFVYGLSALLYGESPSRTAPSSRPTSTPTTCMRIAEMPKVECIVMPSGGFWGGVGEPTICVAAPAVLNAIFAATGKRIARCR